MRKFKCIKEYPGSCKLGEVLKEYDIEGQMYYKSDDGYLIYHTDVEDYLEFFEEVKEEFEIIRISYDTLDNSSVIYSILRKSDNTIFTIGDKVYNPKCSSQNFTITSFYLDCNNEHLLCGPGHINITKIEHYNKLDVPIGTKFKADHNDTIFRIDTVQNEFVLIFWTTAGIDHRIDYSIETVNEYFKTGVWIIYKEEEFEILEYTNELCAFSTKCKTNCTCLNSKDKCKITKVKRLSDNVVFSVGDKVKYSTGSIKWNIDNFYIRKDGILLVRSKDCINVETISTIEHCKEPLFLDELGNEVFEGDKVFSVCHKYNWEIEDNRSVNKASKFVQDNYKEQAAWKFFKYKEDRDNYILENKPRFSKKQVLDALEWGKYEYYRSIASTEWFRVVKEKLGL